MHMIKDSLKIIFSSIKGHFSWRHLTNTWELFGAEFLFNNLFQIILDDLAKHIYVRMKCWRFFSAFIPQNWLFNDGRHQQKFARKLVLLLEGEESIFTQSYEWILERSGVSGLGRWDQNNLRQTMKVLPPSLLPPSSSGSVKEDLKFKSHGSATSIWMNETTKSSLPSTLC